MIISQFLQSRIDLAQTFQKELLNRFGSRSFTSLQLVEALAHASKPTSVVELSQERPFQRSYSTINKVLNDYYILIARHDPFKRNDRNAPFNRFQPLRIIATMLPHEITVVPFEMRGNSRVHGFKCRCDVFTLIPVES